MIKIIRESDNAEQIIKRRWKLNKVQVDAILGMRLRQLRKLEETQIKKEYDQLSTELKNLVQLLKSKTRQRKLIESELENLRQRLTASDFELRKTQFAEVQSIHEMPPIEATVDREPITIIYSEKGWIRAAKNHVVWDDNLKFKEGDGCRFLVHGYTNDRLLMFGTNGRFYTVLCDNLPSGRGFGEPVRLMVDLSNENDLVSLKIHTVGGQLLVTGSDGRGFIVGEDDVVAQTRAGKQILNVPSGVNAVACVPADGDTIAAVGENHKLLLFGREQVPTMTRGRGVIIQRFRDGGLSDVKVFQLADGLSCKQGDRTRTFTDLGPWGSKRAQAGRLAPTGFPRDNKFGIY